MGFRLRRSFGAVVCVLLAALLAVPPGLLAQQHVVRPADIHKELVNATEKRKQDREKVLQLFSSDEAQNAVQAAGMDPGEVRSAVALLSDAELAALAARSDKLREDFAAGAFSNRELLIIIVVVAVIILILVAV
ncbi:MAG: PA2779 family protein [Aridibacter famidurans]|nr:PA2779 family protein [Aridibacter famidurans]